ncbi:MAG: division/cell wall cluster transcriptional repressor MraZ, partial [Clostridia bacterium]|nr:division/cell wall cluster transcriptional repressor MraZ [Clostridia bacterium]
MFGGEYRHNKDSKNRVFMPAKLREELGETFVIAKDIREKCLKVYSLAGWEEYIAPLKEQNRKLSEKILRFLHASLAQVTPDSQGRVAHAVATRPAVAFKNAHAATGIS